MLIGKVLPHVAARSKQKGSRGWGGGGMKQIKHFLVGEKLSTKKCYESSENSKDIGFYLSL